MYADGPTSTYDPLIGIFQNSERNFGRTGSDTVLFEMTKSDNIQLQCFLYAFILLSHVCTSRKGSSYMKPSN